MAIQLPLAKCRKHTNLRKSKAGKYTFLQIAEAANVPILESGEATLQLWQLKMAGQVSSKKELHPLQAGLHRGVIRESQLLRFLPGR